MLQIS